METKKWLRLVLWSSDKTGRKITQTTGDRWTLLYKQKKGSHTKEVLAVFGLQSICQMSRKKREVVIPERVKLGEYF